MAKKKEIEEENVGWLDLLLFLILTTPPKEPKVINIYMGDE